MQSFRLLQLFARSVKLYTNEHFFGLLDNTHLGNQLFSLLEIEFEILFFVIICIRNGTPDSDLGGRMDGCTDFMSTKKIDR